MARLRLVVFALVACRADAAPDSGVRVPAAWRALPELATAVSSAAHATSAEAWGDPARGCYAAWLTVPGEPTAAKTIVDEIQRDVPGIALTEVVTNDSGKEHATTLAFAFERAPYHGRVRALVTPEHAVVALACFWNEREPAACAGACATVLGSLP